jgi:hypothetical protein
VKNNEPSMSQPVKDEEDGQWGMFGESIAEFERLYGFTLPSGTARRDYGRLCL